mmetsp:Transcript_61175/g.192471  ORF Transcript_61175/g.192471 Transcript_61175/m.192471 type:complete len:363 (+) Transcript_61175:58-1146(+)
MDLLAGCADVVVAACDLDKTLHPPHGPKHAEQLRANIKAMFAFEAAGGFVFPVTGNNLLLAQRKFQDPDDESRMLRELKANPGIFTNGGLVLGPHGKEIEKHALGNLYVKDHPRGLDFFSALIDFVDEEVASGSLLKDVGVFCLTPEIALVYDGAPSNGDAYAESQRVTAQRASREELIARRCEILLFLFLFPPVTAPAGAAAEEYKATTLPRQTKVADALKERGLANCSYEGGEVSGVGGGIKVTCMKDPWPEIDINVAGVDKGKALSRFLQNADVLQFLGQTGIDPAMQVVVFGDAPNDIPMFQRIADVQPRLRVAMPDADETLVSLSNVRAEVSDVLEQLCEAKRHRTGGGASAGYGIA